MRRYGLRAVILLLVLGASLWYAFQRLDWPKFKAAIVHADFFWILIGVAATFAAHLVRAIRWRYLIPEGGTISLAAAFRATLLGYAISNIIPRAGELARPYVLARREERSFPTLLASVAVERILDGATLAAIFCVLLVTLRHRIGEFFPGYSATNILLLLVIPLVVLLIAMILLLRTDLGRRWVGKIEVRLPERFRGSLTELIANFRAWAAGGSSRTWSMVALWTIAIWAGYGLTVYSSFLALGLETTYGLTVADVLPVLAVITVAIAIAPTPGALVIYHAAAVAVMMSLFGVSNGDALAFAFVSHDAPYVAVTAIGVLIGFREGISLSEAAHVDRHR